MVVFGHELHFGRAASMNPILYGEGALTLADLPVGGQARVAGFLPGLPMARSRQLQAYGLLPGVELRLLQRSPVFIVVVDHLELALEAGLARGILVEGMEEGESTKDTKQFKVED